MSRGKVIVVEGLIGAGKTTFSLELAQALGDDTLVFKEPDEKGEANPYLADYYEDPGRWAFVMQIHLLQARFRIHKHAQWHALNGGTAVIDRPYFGDTSFARLQLKLGHMSQREYDTYCGIYKAMTASVLLPSHAIWLQVDPEISARRIQSRMEEETGRKCEDAVDLGYLQGLHREIDHMLNVLDRRGVQLLQVDWNGERATVEQRAEVILPLARQILDQPAPKDFLLDLHSRTV